MAWSEHDLERLKALWARGLTSGQIAKELHKSRSAVLGMVHRQKLSRRRAGRQTFDRRFAQLVEGVAEYGLTIIVAASRVGLPLAEAWARWEDLVERYDYGLVEDDSDRERPFR